MDKRTKKFMTISIIAFVIVSSVIYMVFSKNKSNEIELAPATKIIESSSATPTTSNFKVHISGEVMYPGVYDLPSDSRIIDAIKAAGSETDEADLEKLNLAEFIEDAQKIIVPKKSDNNSIETVSSEELSMSENNADDQNSTTTSQTNLVNINTATVAELKTLPRIGDVTANNIIDYRNKNGSFKSKEDLKNVTRIGDKTFESLKDLITIN